MIREEKKIRVVTYQRENLILPRILVGAFAGLVAAGPMALMMIALERTLPKSEQYPLPPRLITEEIIERTGIDEEVSGEEEVTAATWLAHFGYGALTGSLYSLLFGRMRLPSLPKGWAFALTVWSGSYLGWLPASNIFPSATQLPLRRNAIMIASHLLWGSIVALLVNWIEDVL